MKKILGIIAALALAGSVFARPDVTPVITEFTGNAKLEWIANLDADTYGFANSTWTEWKIQTKSGDWGGESNQSADGMWGELVLRTQGDKTFTNPGDIYAWGDVTLEVSTAKLHFIDGDTYFNMDILKPDFKVGEIGYARATKVSYDKNDDGTYKYNWNNWEDLKFSSKGGLNYSGFTLNFGVPIVDLSLSFGDNTAKLKDGKYGFKFAATLKPVDGLSLYAGIAKGTADADPLAMAFDVGYKFSITDEVYVKPVAQFDMVGKASNLGATVLFGWGSEGQTWNHDFLTFDGTKRLTFAENGTRTADGLSVTFIKNLKNDAGNDPKTSELYVECYDNKFLSGLDIGGFTTGFAYRAVGDNLGKGALSFAAIYTNNFDIVYLTARASFGMDLAVEGDNNAFKYGLRVGTKELIANTDIYADYVAGFSKYSPKDDTNKGTFTIGTQINF